MNAAMAELFPGTEKIELKNVLLIPEHCKSGIYKVRVSYDQTIKQIDFDSYSYRNIQSMKVVHHESVDYHLKYNDRQILQELFAQRGSCDDIIIIKNGFVGDSFAANLLFFDGEKWFTPSASLLKGTKRQFLLDHGIISEREIREEDISSYQKIGLINAMVDFEEMPVVSIKDVWI
jgi:4-amino-4-deoxychorismate lyase